MRTEEPARPILLLTGKIVDIGPDNEPLIRKITVIKELAAEEIFVRHMDDPVEIKKYRAYLERRSWY